MTCKIIDGKKIAAAIRQEIKSKVFEFNAKYGFAPCLGVILSNSDPASAIYVRNKQKACREVGIESRLSLPFKDRDSASLGNPLAVLEEHIALFNNDPSVHGVLVQLPLPAPLQGHTTHIFDIIAPEKDVDVFNPFNVGLLVQNRPRFIPCTPRGIQVMLERSGIDTCGKQVVVINRSDIVGKPLSALLIQDEAGANATVTVCHDQTHPETLKNITQTADIVVVAVGIPKFLTADMIKPGAVVIDVGISRVEQRIVGDADFEALLSKASAISPVPGGVGPMTVAMLLENTLQAALLAQRT